MQKQAYDPGCGFKKNIDVKIKTNHKGTFLLSQLILLY